MKSLARISLFVIVLAAIFLAACGPAATATSIAAYDVAPGEGVYNQAPEPAQEAPFAAEAAPEQGRASADAFGLTNGAVIETGDTTLPDAPQPQAGHMIIKNADVKLLVEDTDTAIDRSTQVVGDVGGYIISSRVWYQEYFAESYKYATISIGVPVEQFENAMRRLRGLALKVLDENASGQDVTAEFVDLQSQLGNLEATRDRIRSFLADAKTVEESLRINQELTNIEAQVEQVKGRMNFLSDRSAYSTITINLEPKLPDITPSPTPSPTPTATPVPWNPGKTLDSAKGTVVNIYQGIIEMLIWLAIVVLPLLLPPVLIVWAILKFATRKSRKPASGG